RLGGLRYRRVTDCGVGSFLCVGVAILRTSLGQRSRDRVSPGTLTRIYWRRAWLQLPKRSPTKGGTQPATPSTLPPVNIAPHIGEGEPAPVRLPPGDTEPETPPPPPPPPPGEGTAVQDPGGADTLGLPGLERPAGDTSQSLPEAPAAAPAPLSGPVPVVDP